MKKAFAYLIVWSLIVQSLTATEVFAQDKEQNVKWRVQTLLRTMPETKEKEGGSEIMVTESLTSINAEIFPDSPVTLLWGSNFKNVLISDNATTIDLPSMLVAREMPFGAEFDLPFAGEDSYRLGVLAVPSYYTDSWEDSFNDFETGAFRWISEYWLKLPGNDKFSLKGGIRYKPEHDIRIVPVIDLNIRFTERLSFRITTDDGGLVYQLNDRTKLFTEYRYVVDEYEVSQNGKEGRILLHRQNNAGVGIEHQFMNSWSVTASTGVSYNRKFAFETDPLTKTQLKESLYFSLGVKGQF